MNRIAVTLAVAAIGAAALAGATPALASPSPAPTPTPVPTAGPGEPSKIMSIRAPPGPVVVAANDSTPVKVTVRTTKDVLGLKISIRPPGSGTWERARARAAGGTSEWKEWTRTDAIDWEDPVGTWKVRVSALGMDNKQYIQYGSFVVQHGQGSGVTPSAPQTTSIVGFVATPKQALKGRPVFLRGKLAFDTIVRPANGSSSRLPHQLEGREINLYFQPQGENHGRWKYIDTLETGPDGSFATPVGVTGSGTWKVKYDGSRRLSAAEVVTNVEVPTVSHA